MNDAWGRLAGRETVTFGRRKMAPRACVADGKSHLRAFLRQVLEDFGFITCECASADELQHVLPTHFPDLILFGVSGGIDPGKFLETLVRGAFAGKVLAVGVRESIILKAVQQVGEEYGINMLPPLTTPFGAETLHERVALLLPAERAPSPAVHVSEALHAGWLELWYQPEIDVRMLVRAGADARVRMRHPTWGVVAPAYFIPDERDPHFRALSEFVIERAVQEWHYLLERQSTVDLSINLPASYLTESRAVNDICRRVPKHPAFGGLTIGIDSEEAIRDIDILGEVAREVGLHNIALSINNLGTNWPALMDLKKLPFVKLKIEGQFVSGCSSDRLKRNVCRHIVELAKRYGANTAAVGVESRADLVAAHELGFDLVQGDLFGKPMPVKEFAKSWLQGAVMEQGKS